MMRCGVAFFGVGGSDAFSPRATMSASRRSAVFKTFSQSAYVF